MNTDRYFFLPDEFGVLPSFIAIVCDDVSGAFDINGYETLIIAVADKLYN